MNCVSVIIPTYHRPELLAETIESVWAQSELPAEIVIGDDSMDDRTERLVMDALQARSPVAIRYFHHRPSLREAANVDFLYRHAVGDLALHLHDDDPIYPRCIELLAGPLREHPEAIGCFGLQHLVAETGELISDAGAVNEGYFRTPERAGLVDGLFAGAVSMFPNNGFLVRRDAACAVGYADRGRAGLAADFYFGFRLGQLSRPFFFVPEYTAKVRLTRAALSRTAESDNAYWAVKILLEDLRQEQITPEIERSIQNRIPIAIATASRKGERREALRWMFSRYYRSRILTPRGLKRLWMALRP